MSDKTNEQIRLEIAKAKGWIRHGLNPDVWLPSKAAYKFVPLPNWPEDIAAAWDLMEEMKIVIIGVTFFEGKWTSSYSNEISYSTFDADTAPRAICLAWLAWKESQP